MGINKNTLRFLLLAKKNGVDFSQTAVIGRQTLNMPQEHFLEVMEKESGLNVKHDDLVEIYKFRFADKLFSILGATQYESFDYSDFEQATHLHDFNEPIADQFKNRYTLVIDGGSLEHVFNFPVSISNCMQMVKANGHFISVTPANNNFGHGFYQFSPELFYRVLNSENGYNVKSMYYYDNKFSKNWMSVVDPDKLKKRGYLVNSTPTMLILLAQREAIVPLFKNSPQQSDYQVAWKEKAPNKKAGKSLKSKIASAIPMTYKVWFTNKFKSGPNPEFFKKVDIVDLLRR